MIEPNPQYLRPHPLWTESHRRNLWLQAETGGVLLTGMGNDSALPVLWDHLLLDACQVTNPSIDPLREPMELRTFLGRKPDRWRWSEEGRGLTTTLPPQLQLETPIYFAAMSYGSISLNAQKSIAMAAEELGTVWNTGEGGLHEDLVPYAAPGVRAVRLRALRRDAGVPECGRGGGDQDRAGREAGHRRAPAGREGLRGRVLHAHDSRSARTRFRRRRSTISIRSRTCAN